MNQALAFCAVGTLYYPGFHRGTEPKDICMCIYILREREIYYKKLAHMIIEAKKPSSLPSASWRPRKSGGLILKAWEPESWWYRFQSRSEGLRARELMVQIPVKVWRPESQEQGGQETNIQAHSGREQIQPSSAFLFCPGPQWIGWRPPPLGRAICFFKC